MKAFQDTPSGVVETATDQLGPWFRALARSIQSGIVLVDGSGRATFCNDTARELLYLNGAPEEQALQRVEELLPAEFRVSRRAEGEPRVREDEIELRLDEGHPQRAIRLRSVPIDGDGCGALVTIEDKSRANALEVSLQLANRMRTWRAVRAQVHDLKAPLNALSLHVELLDQSLAEADPDRDAARETTQVLHREIQRMGRSLERFLRGSDAAGAAPRRCDLGEVLRDVAELVGPQAKDADVVLEVVVNETPVHVRAASDALEQVLINLVLNAIDACRRGGRVRLGVEERSDSNGPRARICVEDDGEGIPTKLLEKVFELNFTTKPDGTGIGLSVARSIVSAQGGRLELRSALGVGTTVEIDLPRSTS